MSTSTISEKPTLFHASLQVSDLQTSVAFYERLFDRPPSKHVSDYAKFELENPPLVLSLLPGFLGPGGSLNHLGQRLPDQAHLLRIQEQCERQGIRTHREEGVVCCHSKQSKFWVTDPDQTLWEFYFLEPGETDGEGEKSPIPTAGGPSLIPAVAPRKVWRHHLNQGSVTAIPHPDHSLHEVTLDGSVNLHDAGTHTTALLHESHRALRPGGQLRVHGLSADHALQNRAPQLQGPASLVGEVPAHNELVAALHATGFIGIRFETLSEQAHFTVEGIHLREFLVVAEKPGHRTPTQTHRAIYLGPMAQMVDDAGNRFLRGEVVPLNIHDWQRLQAGSAGSSFLFLSAG